MPTETTTTTERAVAFIVARLSSSRLPAKHLRPIGDRPLLQWVIDRLNFSEEIDQVVLTTVNETENIPLKEIAEVNKIDCFWYEGAVDHVTNRLRCAAEQYAADICILVSGDCPLVDASAIDCMIRTLREHPAADTVALPNDDHGCPPALQGILVNRIKAWQLADDLADRPELKEHQFPVIGLHPALFQFVPARLQPDLYLPHHRLSVDTLSDLDFMNAAYDLLAAGHMPFELANVVSLLHERPQLRKINDHVHQRRLVEAIKKVLFVADAGGGFGYGHLTRSMELARQIIERLGWPVHFLVDDQNAKEMVEEIGCHAYWGAFGRYANPDPEGNLCTIESIIEAYDLLVLDIFDQRGPQPGWRSHIPSFVDCVVIENIQPWAREAEMIVLPNILDKKAGLPTDVKWPKIIGGERFVILRGDIRRLAVDLPAKEIDVLVYLHDHKRRENLVQRLDAMALTAKVVQRFANSFAKDLARSRILVSGFGVSFNEALALRTRPVCWPDSDAHRDDAVRFYRSLGVAPVIIESIDDIETVIGPLINEAWQPKIIVKDGTPDIVAEIAVLGESP